MNNGRTSSASMQGQGYSSNRPLCRYFANNVCYKGDSCEFSHERNARQDMNCRYYLAGNCSYGKHCRYDHTRPNTGNCLTSVNKQPPKKEQPATSKVLNVNGEKIVPASTPQKNAWNISPLNNFHSSIANELELIGHELPGSSTAVNSLRQMTMSEMPLCPYFEVGFCGEGDLCKFVHGIMCDMCNLNVLHPYNESQQVAHHRECLAEHEKQMEAAFAEAKSAEKQCGICMEMIVEKGLRFGLLQNCVHCYCLECIRKWRRHNDEQIETKIVRACPECRVHSNYVIPSKIWVDEKAEKEKLISLFKENTRKIPCKYVTNGDVDKCPFGNKCFYKHQLPDGTVVEGKSPSELRKQRRRREFNFELYDYLFLSSDSEDDSDFIV